MGYRKGGRMSMKRNHITLFGLPTLLTVLIVILVFSFSTLSFLNELNIKKSIDRGNQILSDTYNLQYEMDLLIIEIENEINNKEFDFNRKDILFDRTNQQLQITLNRENLILNVKLNIIQKERIDLKIIEYRISYGNDQDYTQDGDPVYGG